MRSKSLLSFLVLLALPIMANAAVIETQALSFGEFAMRNNDASYDLTISPTGGISRDPIFLPFEDPQPGSYAVSGFPASTALIINVTFNDLTGGGTQNFTISSAVISPATVTTDGAGEASFNVGATLSSSGTGVVYSDSTYNGLMTVSVNY